MLGSGRIPSPWVSSSVANAWAGSWKKRSYLFQNTTCFEHWEQSKAISLEGQWPPLKNQHVWNWFKDCFETVRFRTPCHVKRLSKMWVLCIDWNAPFNLSFVPHPALQDNVWRSLCLGSSDIFSIRLWKYPTLAGLCKKTVSSPFCVEPLMCPLEFHEALWVDATWTNCVWINRCPLSSRSWRRLEVQNQWNLSSSFNGTWHMNIPKESGRKGFAKWLSSEALLRGVGEFLKLKGWRMSRESYNGRVRHPSGEDGEKSWIVDHADAE